MVSFRNICAKLNFLIIRLTVCFSSVVTHGYFSGDSGGNFSYFGTVYLAGGGKILINLRGCYYIIFTLVCIALYMPVCCVNR